MPPPGYRKGLDGKFHPPKKIVPATVSNVQATTNNNTTRINDNNGNDDDDVTQNASTSRAKSPEQIIAKIESSDSTAAIQPRPQCEKTPTITLEEILTLIRSSNLKREDYDEIVKTATTKIEELVLPHSHPAFKNLVSTCIDELCFSLKITSPDSEIPSSDLDTLRDKVSANNPFRLEQPPKKDAAAFAGERVLLTQQSHVPRKMCLDEGLLSTYKATFIGGAFEEQCCVSLAQRCKCAAVQLNFEMDGRKSDAYLGPRLDDLVKAARRFTTLDNNAASHSGLQRRGFVVRNFGSAEFADIVVFLPGRLLLIQNKWSYRGSNEYPDSWKTLGAASQRSGLADKATLALVRKLCRGCVASTTDGRDTTEEEAFNRTRIGCIVVGVAGVKTTAFTDFVLKEFHNDGKVEDRDAKKRVFLAKDDAAIRRDRDRCHVILGLVDEDDDKAPLCVHIPCSKPPEKTGLKTLQNHAKAVRKRRTAAASAVAVADSTNKNDNDDS